MSENGLSENGYLGPDIIETTDEEGVVHVFEKVDEYELEGNRYALLIYQGSGDEQPKPDEEGYEEEVVVMKVSVEDGDEVFEAIEDPTEFDRVVKYIEDQINTMEDDEEDDDDDDEDSEKGEKGEVVLEWEESDN